MFRQNLAANGGRSYRKRAAMSRRASAERAEHAKRCAMTFASQPNGLLDRLLAAWRERAVALKALSFAMVGVVNTAIDFSVFLGARHVLASAAGSGLVA